MFLTKKFNLGLTLMLFCILLSACGPSPEELAATSAAETAAAATNTPTITPTMTPTPTSTPTPTPTPVPYDLSVLVVGEEETPIIEARIIMAEISEDDGGSQISDEVGQAFWFDLPGETVNLNVSAQGYFPIVVSESLERGINQMTISLERDPHGLLPSEACGSGEILLYMNDFQDGEVKYLPEVESLVQGWDISPHPDSQGNWVLLNKGNQWTMSILQNHEFESAAWRIKFMTDNMRNIEFGWRIKNDYTNELGDVESSAYSLRFEPGWFGIFKKIWPLSNVNLLNTNLYLTSGTWHQLEISTYEGRLEVWLNGRRMLAYDDPNPLPRGSFGLSIEDSPGLESTYYFDDISVCEQTAPFAPLPTPEP